MGRRTLGAEPSLIVATVPIDAVAGVVSALVVAVFWLARQIARATERIARLEGRLNGRPGEPRHDR